MKNTPALIDQATVNLRMRLKLLTQRARVLFDLDRIEHRIDCEARALNLTKAELRRVVKKAGRP